MIRIICTSCRAELEIDDAFAGGVCRCQHCGTIQTVPSAREAAAARSTTQSGNKALYQRKTRAESQGSGLDDLADAVTSSGLIGSGSGLASSRLVKKTPDPAAATANSKPKWLMPVLIIGGTIVIVLTVLVIVLALRSSESPNQQNTGNSGAPQSAQQGNNSDNVGVGSNPNFGGVLNLKVPSVIYVLDRGSGTRDWFSSVKDACYASIQSLGPGRQFQIIFWSNGQSEVSYPDSTLVYAGEANIKAARAACDDVMAAGQSDAERSLFKAFKQSPAAVVLVTAKGWDLDNGFVNMVMKVRGSSPTKVHTIALGGSGTSSALKEVAQKTGGEYREVQKGDLK